VSFPCYKLRTTHCLPRWPDHPMGWRVCPHVTTTSVGLEDTRACRHKHVFSHVFDTCWPRGLHIFVHVHASKRRRCHSGLTCSRNARVVRSLAGTRRR
jgi:hypothetical protein